LQESIESNLARERGLENAREFLKIENGSLRSKRE